MRGSRRPLWRSVALLLSLVRLHPVPFLLSLAGSAVYGGSVVVSSYVLGWAVDNVVVPRFARADLSTATMVTGALLLFAVGLVKTVATVVRRSMAAVAKARSDASLREQVVDRYQAVPYTYHQRRPTGELLAHTNSDPEAAAEVPAKMPLAIGLIVLFVAAAGWIIATDLSLAAVALLVLPTLVAANSWYQRQVAPLAATVQHGVGAVSAVAHESFDGAQTVKVLGGLKSERARFAEVARRLADAKVGVAQRAATFDVLLESIPALAVILVVAVGAWRVNSGMITVGDLVSVVNLLSLLTFPLRIIGYVLGDVPRSLAGYDRVRAVLAEPAASRAKAGPTRSGTVVVRDLGFGYTAPVLESVSFEVPEGSSLAVAGPAGAGKSTLLLLLAGLLHPDTGHVRLGDVDAAEVDADAVGMVFQEPFLFAASIEENLSLGRPVEPAVRTWALRLAAADFVTELPDGLATQVGERGVTLSGGQRQRIALARALVRRPRLLLLDDAMSAVDATTEDRILHSLADYPATTVMVTNRSATLALADRVVYLERGRLAATGTHTQLLATTPAYAELVRAYEADRAA